MVKCDECEKEFINIIGLLIHVRKAHNITSEEYYLKNINPEKGVCKTCGKLTTFINFSEGYRKFCNTKCYANNTECRNAYKENCMKKYGVENPSQSEEIKQKKKDTCMKNHGVEHPFQNSKIRDKSKQTCKEKYGCGYPNQNSKIRDKSKQTCKEKYGVENPSQIEEVKQKKKDTCMKNHGCIYPLQNEEVKNKVKDTCIKKYGCEHASQSERSITNRKNTFMKKYGFKHPMNNKKIREKNELTFKRIQKKYYDLIKIEELISGPNGEILGHCKNSNCKNSKENNGYFKPTSEQLRLRNIGINSQSDTNYLYCCEECKHECPLFGKSASQLHNLVNEDHEINYTQNELSIWRKEILTRQLQENSKSENFCEICHSTENLQIHHIQPQKLEPGYALDPPNGLILCQKCHLEKGHEKGTKCSNGNLSNLICG